jgi:hypothetical protein
VSDLKLLLPSKVAQFTAEFAAVKASLNVDKEHDVNFLLAKVQVEKTLVAKLKAAFQFQGRVN